VVQQASGAANSVGAKRQAHWKPDLAKKLKVMLINSHPSFLFAPLALPGVGFSQPRPTAPLQEFPLLAVQLLDSPFLAAQQTDKAYIMALDPDRLLAATGDAQPGTVCYPHGAARAQRAARAVSKGQVLALASRGVQVVEEK
jgi:hypothetical protein